MYLDQARNGNILASSVTEDRAVISIIQDALEDAEGGGHPDPEVIWADIAATLGITT